MRLFVLMLALSGCGLFDQPVVCPAPKVVVVKPAVQIAPTPAPALKKTEAGQQWPDAHEDTSLTGSLARIEGKIEALKVRTEGKKK